jgi:hypothetical protein
MPQPTPYSRGYSFTDFQASNPSVPLPAPHVDAELDGIETTLHGVLGNLSLIQRDDGALAEGCVTLDSISPTLFASIVEAAGGGDYLAPNLTFTAHTLAPGAAATVNMTGVYPNLTIDIGVPKGDAASPGAATLANGNYGDVTVSGGGSVMTVTKVNGAVPSFPGHTHVMADITGLVAALAGKQAAGSYATTAQLALKADALTPITNFNGDYPNVDALNGTYQRFTGNVGRTVTFGLAPDGMALILVNRGTANLTIACPGGYFKNGAVASSVANLTMVPGGRLTAFYEGYGIWTFDGTGF